MTTANTTTDLTPARLAELRQDDAPCTSCGSVLCCDPDAQLRDEITRLRAENDAMAAALATIQELAEDDIQRGIVPDNNIVWQIEADARAALAKRNAK